MLIGWNIALNFMWPSPFSLDFIYIFSTFYLIKNPDQAGAEVSAWSFDLSVYPSDTYWRTSGHTSSSTFFVFSYVWFAAVSYTHLDVYKRQLYVWTCTIQSGKISCCNSSGRTPAGTALYDLSLIHIYGKSTISNKRIFRCFFVFQIIFYICHAAFFLTSKNLPYFCLLYTSRQRMWPSQMYLL